MPLKNSKISSCSAVLLGFALLTSRGLADEQVALSTVPPDLKVPKLSSGSPVAGRRVKQAHPDYDGTEVHHVLYLPKNWEPGKRFPMIVEYAGNLYGKTSTGRVEGSKLGYGMSGGDDFIWLCLPYLNAGADSNVVRWWGDQPEYDVGPTVEYCKKTVPWVCEKYGGDPRRVVLAGFSRGAIACNFIGLQDDQISKLWRGFLPYSHYDGVNEYWPFPGSDRKFALERLRRLSGRKQLILHEGSIKETKAYLESTGVDLSNLSFMSTGFRDHDDAWILRPSAARDAVRRWLAALMKP